MSDRTQLPPELIALTMHDPLVAAAVARYEASPGMTVGECLRLLAVARLLAVGMCGIDDASGQMGILVPGLVWRQAAYLARAARLSRAGLRRRGSNGWG